MLITLKMRKKFLNKFLILLLYVKTYNLIYLNKKKEKFISENMEIVS